MHFSVVLFVFQAIAAVAVVGSTVVTRDARIAAAILIVLNGVVSLVAPYDAAGESVAARVGQAADAPTAVVITYLALALIHGSPGPARRWVMRALIMAGAVACAGGFAFNAPGPQWFTLLYVSYGARLSYALILIVLLRESLLRPTWPAMWLLGAFLLRAADLAIHYSPTAVTIDIPATLVLSGVVAATVIIPLLSRRATSELKRIVLILALAGALFGALARFTTSSLAAYHESLVTLAVGRPALMVVALRAPGFVRPFFRAVFIGLTAYLATIVALRGLDAFSEPYLEALLALAAAGVVVASWWGLGRSMTQGMDAPVPAGAQGAISSLVATVGPFEGPDRPASPPGLEDWERLVRLLAREPEGRALSRRAIADQLGILPRNVQRVVDAANRAPGVSPGGQLVEARYARGSRNQLQFEYAITKAGREHVAALDADGRSDHRS